MNTQKKVKVKRLPSDYMSKLTEIRGYIKTIKNLVRALSNRSVIECPGTNSRLTQIELTQLTKSTNAAIKLLVTNAYNRMGITPLDDSQQLEKQVNAVRFAQYSDQAIDYFRGVISNLGISEDLWLVDSRENIALSSLFLIVYHAAWKSQGLKNIKEGDTVWSPATDEFMDVFDSSPGFVFTVNGREVDVASRSRSTKKKDTPTDADRRLKLTDYLVRKGYATRRDGLFYIKLKKVITVQGCIVVSLEETTKPTQRVKESWHSRTVQFKKMIEEAKTQGSQ
jgi:hypothetical protein